MLHYISIRNHELNNVKLGFNHDTHVVYIQEKKIILSPPHCAQNSKLWKKVYIYTLKCHMELNETILKMPQCQQKFNENKIEILSFLGGTGA